MKYQFRVEGNTLLLTQKTADVNCRLGQRAVPSSGPAGETRLKLTRISNAERFGKGARKAAQPNVAADKPRSTLIRIREVLSRGVAER